MGNTFFIISIAGYVISAICGIIAIVLFFKLNIRYVIKDLNGTLAEKEISELRKKSTQHKQVRMDYFDPKTGNTGNAGNTAKSKNTGNMAIIEETQNEALQETTNFSVEIGHEDPGTSVLQAHRVINKDFIIVTDIVYVHTNESI